MKFIKRQPTDLKKGIAYLVVVNKNHVFISEVYEDYDNVWYFYDKERVLTLYCDQVVEIDEMILE